MQVCTYCNYSQRLAVGSAAAGEPCRGAAETQLDLAQSGGPHHGQPLPPQWECRHYRAVPERTTGDDGEMQWPLSVTYKERRENNFSR